MRIAIVGLACLFPGAPDLARFWRNIVDGVDAIGEVPPGRWDASFYDPQSTAVDRFYCKRGGFVDNYADFDPLAFGVMPKATDSIEPDQLLTLKVGVDALRDAGYGAADARPFARERTGVIVGRGNYIGAGVLRLEQHVRLLPQIEQTLRDLFPELGEAAIAAARERLRREFAYYGPDVAAGMIPNLLASRLANRLDLHGPAYTVDAACASSLIAVEQACAALARGETDMMLAGGAHLTHDLTFWATFCQLGALSRSGSIRPFSADADGILAGEGVGMAVLKRYDDALADGDRIYAVIEGCGSSSDGRSASLVAPSASGQRIALDKAWAKVPFERDEVGLLEAHGTGTPTGDAVELQTMAAFFGPHAGDGERAVIGSVKSMIGHAMPASGMASLIKSALAIHHGVLPPTLHCEQPHPQLAATRFRVIGRSEPWPQPQARRVAAVNAFGFGGINAHLVLRGVETAQHQPAAAPPPRLMLSAATPEALLARLDAGDNDALPVDAPCRLVVIEPDAKRLAMARKAVVSGKPWSGRQQIWFSPHGLLSDGGKLAFVFPGVDSTFAPRAQDLATYFGKPLPRWCEPLDPAESLMKVVIGLLGFNDYTSGLLADLGIRPDVCAGHSIGEWSAMLYSDMIGREESERMISQLDLDAIEFPDVQFLAAACSQARLLAAISGLERIAISHDNCPHQVIACGERAAVEIVASRLRTQGVFVQVLPFVSGFHSPLFAEHMDLYREFFGGAALTEPAMPMWSATIAGQFPADLDGKRKLALEHLLKPVRFRELTEALYDDGVRVFVQLGTGSLPGFIDDTLSGKPHRALACHNESRSGLAQLQQLCAALWVEGARFDTRLLHAEQPSREVPSPSTRRLSLGVPLVRVREPLAAELLPARAGGAALPEIAANDPVGRLVRDTLADIERAGREVLAAWQQHRAAGPAAVAAPPSGRISRRVVQRHLDVTGNIAYVNDHELFPQRPGWPIVADRHPVVPMTMEIALMREAVEEALPQFKAVALSQIQAFNWLAVSQPLTIDIVMQSLDDDTVDVEITGYFRARVHIAEHYPQADIAPLPPLIAPRATEATAEQIYSDGWMFHGPAYQGVAAFEAIGDNGIDGQLRVPSGKGALLDNMGQLAGYWVMEQPRDCFAMPIGIDRVIFYAPDPQPGEMLHAQVRITALDDIGCGSDHQLRDAQGRLYLRIEGWRTRRYQIDKAFAMASRKLSRAQVSQSVPPDVALFDDHYDTAIMRDFISRRYLTTSERLFYNELSPRRRRQWLSGRVAAKDAVRAWLWAQRGAVEIYPQELLIDNDERGVPRVAAHVTDAVPEGLHLSITHKDRFAAAIVGTQPVGIDLERVEPRERGFIEMTFTVDERALLMHNAASDADVEYTRGWVAKEAAAKAAGTGLGGHLRDYLIEARDGDCLRVAGRWIVTHALPGYVLGWTLDGAMPAHTETSDELALSRIANTP